jgi:hypothetical protein
VAALAHRLGRVWRRIRRPADALLAAQVVLWLGIAVVLVRTLPPKAALRAMAGRRRAREVRWPHVERTRAMVDAWIGVWPFRGHGACLSRSLVLCRLLRAQGLEVGLELGVRRVGGRLAGHSWVTWRGQPLFERVDPGRDFATMAHWS